MIPIVSAFKISYLQELNERQKYMVSIFDSYEFNQNLFFPRPDNSVCPSGAEDIFVEVENNCKLHIRHYVSERAVFSILFFHGNGEVISDYDDIAKYFKVLGCDFLVCDYRGYGKSDGIPSLRSTLIDASILYRHLIDNNLLKKNVCVMGRSLGSAPTIEVCSRFSTITCCVIESGYADPIPLVERRGLHITNITAEENTTFSNSEKIKSLKCSILIMHGAEDNLINPSEARVNYKNACSINKELAILKGVGHNDMMMAHDNEYFSILSTYFQRHFHNS